jgi:hypothetical protein
MIIRETHTLGKIDALLVANPKNINKYK